MSIARIESAIGLSDPGARDAAGRFAAGNAGGPGRPRRAIETDYLAALSDAVPMDRWRKIVERAVTDAEQGDVKAREWLGSYLAGKPTGNGLRKIAVDEAGRGGSASRVRPHGRDAGPHQPLRC